MKKLLIALLLFSGSVGAADFCGTFAEYRSQIKLHLNVGLGDVTGIYSDTNMNQLIREGVVFATNIRKAPRISKRFVTVADSGTYALDSLLLDVTDVQWKSGDSIMPLKYLPKSQWPTVMIGAVSNYDGFDQRPAFYDWTDGLIHLGPPPDSTGDTIVVDGYRKVPSISAVDSTMVLPQKYRLIVIDYVAVIIGSAVGHPSTPLIQMRLDKNVGLIRSSREGQQ